MPCPLCNDTGDQRYWEGRWRDADAEIAKLNEECQASMGEIENLRAEIAKLRAALQSVIDQAETVCLWDAQQIARRALEQQS